MILLPLRDLGTSVLFNFSPIISLSLSTTKAQIWFWSAQQWNFRLDRTLLIWLRSLKEVIDCESIVLCSCMHICRSFRFSSRRQRGKSLDCQAGEMRPHARIAPGADLMCIDRTQIKKFFFCHSTYHCGVAKQEVCITRFLWLLRIRPLGKSH